MAGGRVFSRSEVIALLMLIHCLRAEDLGSRCSGRNLRRTLHKFEETAQQNKPITTEFLTTLSTLPGRHLRPTPRGRRHFSARIQYYTNAMASFHLARLVNSGDISTNSGPISATKCSPCARTIARNYRAVFCDRCDIWCHIVKCGGVTPRSYKLMKMATENHAWMCNNCLWKQLPFTITNNFGKEATPEISTEANNANHAPSTPQPNELQDAMNSQLIKNRDNNSREVLVVHLNINSIQNKFEELKLLNDSLKGQIIIISEPKIDRSYPNSQFKLRGYHMYRRDRSKGGGGLIAYCTSLLPSKTVKIPRSYKTLEAIAIESKVGQNDVIFLAIAIDRPKSLDVTQITTI